MSGRRGGGTVSRMRNGRPGSARSVTDVGIFSRSPSLAFRADVGRDWRGGSSWKNGWPIDTHDDIETDHRTTTGLSRRLPGDWPGEVGSGAGGVLARAALWGSENLGDVPGSI